MYGVEAQRVMGRSAEYRGAVGRVFAAVVVGALLLTGAPIGAATAAEEPSPTPSVTTPLGSAEPEGSPGGAADGDPADTNRAPLAIAAPLALAILVGGTFVVYLIRRSRRPRSAGDR